MGRNHINVVIATIHVLRLVILKNTCEHILMRNLTNGDHCDYASATASHLRRHEKTHKNPKKGAKLTNQSVQHQQKQSTPATSIGVQCNKCTHFCLTPDMLKQRKSTQDRRSTHVNYVGMSASSQVHWSDTSRLTKGIRVSNVYKVVDTIQRLNIW